MRTLYLKPFRDIRRIKLRSLTVSLMVAIGLGTYAGLLMSRDTLFHTRDTMYEDLHLADLRVITTAADPTEIPPLDHIPGVGRYVKRFVTPGSIELKNGRPLSCLVVYMDPVPHPGVNDLEILKGNYLRAGDTHGVDVERSLVEIHGFSIGERITLNPYSTPTEVTILGSAISPQYLIATVDATVFLPMRGSLGIVYAPISLVESYFGYPLYNEFSFVFEKDADRAQVEERIHKLLSPLGIESFIRRNEEFAYRVLDETMKGFSSFIPSLVMVFGLIIFVVTLITANRLVITQRREIGVLRSLGYRRREVSFSYVLIAAILCAAGGVLGTGISLLINILFAGKYGYALGLPTIIPKIVFHYILEGWLLASGIVLLAFAVPILRITRLAPQRILREDRRQIFRGTPAFVERALLLLSGFIRDKVSFRFGVRNLFRRLGLTATTILSVGLSLGLAGSLAIVLSSIEANKTQSMAREEWDVMVNFRYPLDPEAAKKILQGAGIERSVLGIMGFGQVRIDGVPLDYRLLGFPASGWMRKLDLVQGRMFESDSERGIILNNNWIDKERVHLNVGKTVMVRVGDREEPLTIVGLMNDMTVGQAYVPFETAQDLFGGEGKVNGLMATTSLPIEKVKEGLYRHEEVKEVFGMADVEKAMDEYVDNLKGIDHASVGVSISIALFFLLGSVLLNVLEREMEYATLRAIGYNRRMISKIVLTELMTEAVTAVLLSIPVAVLLALFINYQQGKIYFHIPTVISWPGLLSVSVWALVFIPFASLPGLRHLFRLRIAQVVREKVMG